METAVMHRKLREFLSNSPDKQYDVTVKNRMRQFGAVELDSSVLSAEWNKDNLLMYTTNGPIEIHGVEKVVLFSFGCKIIVSYGTSEITAVELEKYGLSQFGGIAPKRYSRGERRNTHLLNSLLWATEKEHEYRHAKKSLSSAVAKDDRKSIVSRAEELVSASMKREGRISATKLYTSSDLAVVVLHSESREQLVRGRLVGLDFARATLKIRDDDGLSHVVMYAQPRAVPADLQQQYYGHELLVAIKVLHVKPERAWILEQ